MIYLGYILTLAVTFLLSLLYPVSSGGLVVEEGTQIDVYFCPDDLCGRRMSELIESSNESVDCALYDLELENVMSALDGENYRLVVDKKNTGDIDGLSYVKNDKTWQLMHNKFCVIDGEITITGSFNPTVRGDTRNNNNIVIIRSRYISENYLDEFEELYGGVFGSGNNARYPLVSLDGIVAENYFCPEDLCEEHVIENLKRAKTSIYFMTFSFTSHPIGDFLVQNKNKINSTDTISGKYILQVGNQLIFKDDVILNRNNELILNTHFLKYNMKTQIGQNKHKFKLDYMDNTLVGNMLYFDGINDIIKADYIKFELQMREKE